MTDTILATYEELGHKEFWDRVYGAAPEGPTAWDIEDYCEEYCVTPEEARAILTKKA